MKKYLKHIQDFLMTYMIRGKKWRRLVTAMAMAVVFVTTYALILPAITLEKDEGKPDQGVYLDDMERGSTASLTESPLSHDSEQTQKDQSQKDLTEKNQSQEDQDQEKQSQKDQSQNKETSQTEYANGIYTGKGDGYTLSLDLKEEMRLPADVTISVEEIKEDKDTAAVYRSYMAAAKRAAAREGRGEFTSVRFIKFALYSDGKEVRTNQDIDVLVLPTEKDIVRNGDEAHVLTFQESVAHMVEDVTTQKSGYRVSAYRFFYPSTVNNRNWGLLCFAVTEPKAEEEEKTEEVAAETTDSTETEPSIEEEQASTEETSAAVSTEEGAASTEENAASTEEMAASTEEMAASTEEIAASTEETSASTEEIAATEESTETEPTNTEAEENRKYVEKLEYQGQDYKVVMTCDDKAGIPEGAALQVTEIRKNSDDYEKYLQEASETLEMNKMANPTARFFDIKIMDGDQEIEPAAPVSVEITYDKPMEVKEGEKVDALHFGEKKTEVIDDVEVQTNKNDDVKSVTFDADSFSVYGVLTYTVDFTFDGYTYSIEGNSTIKLSKLVEILEIAGKDKDYETGMAFVKDVEEVTFTDESLVKVEKAGLFGTGVFSWGDWELISQKPFDTEETLTIAMKDGIKYEIQVTDARKPVLSNTYGRIKIVKEWYDAEGHRIEAPTLDDTYTSDFILTAYEYAPSDLVRLHFVGADGNDVNDPVIVPTGSLQVTLYNTPDGDGKGYVFSEKPTNVDNPYNNINLLTDVAIQSKTAKLDSGETINTWIMNIDLNDYAGELYDVYLGIQPGNETTGLSYFTSTTAPTWGAGVSGSTHAMNIAFLDSGRWQGDTYRNRHIWDMIKGQNNEYTLQNQDLELTSAGGKFFAYSIVENDASANGAKNFTTTISWNNGANTIYSNGLTGWSPNLYLNTPVLSNTDATVVTVKNQMRADVDVPVEKHWPYMDEYDEQYDWEAKFVLQYAPLYEGEGTPSTEFKEVEPRQYITITEAQMDDFGNSFSARSFKNLPMYGEDENGPFRYEYSVEEESYKIYEHGNPSNVLATYDRNAPEGEQYTGGLPHFEPFYPHDAGELSANPSDYMVMVTNGQAYSEDSPTINITVNKLWEDEEVMEDDTHDYKAYVKIQRYDQQSTRKLQDYDPDTMVEIKFFDQNNNYVKSEYVEKGVQQRLHITWNSYGYGYSKFALTSSPNVVNFSKTDHQCGYGETLDDYTDWFYPTDGMEIRVSTNSWNDANDPAVNLKASGLELLDEQTSAPGAPDNAYNNDPENEFTLSMLQNRWSTIITDLPLVEYTRDGDTQTVHHYSYYFVEEEEKTTPAGYKSSYVRYDTVGTDHEIELGDDKYRINYDGEHVTIKNTKDTLRIHKEWRGVAKSDWPLYPNTVFDLYGANRNTPLNNATDGTLIRSGLQLNKTNNWEWMPEDEDWGAGGFPQYDYYYVVERTDLMAANAELGTPAWDNRYEIWMYYNENGTGSNAHPWEAKTSGTGSITILNALHDSEYLQIDLKKKWMEWGTPTSWDTTTGVYKRLHDLVMGFVVYRRVWDVPIQSSSQYSNNNGHIISPGPMGWSDYGNEILVGYDSNGQRVLDDGGNTFELINGDGGNWHWTIKNQADHGKTTSDQIGLTSEGWYTKEDGSVVWAYYEYTVRETGIWKNLKKDPVDDPEISWFSNSVPMAAWYKSSSQHRVDEFNRDIGQDQDRLMNGQAFDMYVEKQWDDSAWDAREVYVKIYRQSLNGQYKDDFTAELARDIKIGNLIGYLNGNESMIDVDNEWIVFTPSRSGLYIDKVLKAYPNTSGSNPYVYWMVEVGYKDKHGNVHMYDTGSNDVVNQSAVTDNDLLKLMPTYYTWQDGHYVSGHKPGQNNPNVGIVVGDKGTNKLMVKNTPVRDFAVVKKWQDALGNDISNDPAVPNNLNIKIKQTRTTTIEGNTQTYEGYVSFGGSQTLTLTKPNSDNKVIVVAQTHPGNAAGAQSYSATVSNDSNFGAWGLYISGLEEKYYDENGNLWVCTYKVEEQTDGIPNTFVTEVSYDGIIDRDNRNITITNVKLEGGMLKVVKQIAEGSNYNTEDPFKITVTLTPPLKPGPEGEQGKREDVFDLGPAEHPNHTVSDYIEIDEEDTILIGTPETSVADDKTVTITMTLAGRGSFTIKDIKVGTTYEVSEDLSGTHGWRQDGEVAYSNSGKTIVKRQLDTAAITNKEAQDGALMISKIVKVNGRNAGESQYDLVDGDYIFTITGPTAVEAGMQVTKFVKITVEQGQVASYKVSDTDTEAAWKAATAVTGTWAVVDGLEEGDYVITEAAVESMTVSSITGGKNNGDTDARTITVHVTAGDTTAAESDAQATYTNNRSMVDIKIIKIDEITRSSASQTKLPGATFKLYRYSVPSGSDTGTYVVYPDEAGSTATTSNESGENYGTLSFRNLPDGYYKISETAVPEGYIKSDNNDIYFDIAGGAVTRYTGAYTGTARSSADEIAETSNVAMVTYMKADKTFTVGNTPGAALPSTGGPGTWTFILLGGALSILAVFLLRNRRLKPLWKH